jgi:hypothetical protein
MVKRCVFNREKIAGIRPKVYGVEKSCVDRINYGGKDTDLNKLLHREELLC